jgi:predicted DNA-binding protein (UPF0251 family)
LSTNLKQHDNSDLTDWISQSEAARLRSVTRQAIAKLVKKGRLKVLVLGGHTFVSKAEITSFEMQAAGRPKKEKND